MPTEVSVEADQLWRTWKRVLPLDVYEELKRFEELVAEHSGMPARFQGIGQCVSVWSVIAQQLRDHEEELVALAKEWSGRNDEAKTQSDQ